MDTRGKTNAEFRNEVNEALARHESNFDQVNTTLQTVLTEIQALRSTRSSHACPPEVNPMAQEGSSHHPHATPSAAGYNHSPPSSLKLQFPKFNGEDPMGWIYKAEQYFEYQGIRADQRVQLASFHLEGIALQWHRWHTKFREPPTWEELTKAVLLRFGPTEFEDPSEALSRLKQTTTVATYQEAFERLSHRVDKLPETFLIGCFIAGLRDDIRLDVKIKQPRTLADTIGVARLVEERNQLQRRPTPINRMQTGAPLPRGNPNPAAGILGSTPSQRSGMGSNAPPSPFRRITNQEARERREKGLCYYCDEKYSLGHRCERPQLFMIEDAPHMEKENGENGEEPPQEAETQELLPEISFHAIAGAEHPQTLRVLGKWKNKSLMVLIDGGSTHNFIDQHTASRFGLPILRDKKLQVVVANRERIECTGRCQGLMLTIQGIPITADYYVLPVAACQAVLGVQWLETLGPLEMDYKRLIMSFRVRGTTHTLHGLGRTAECASIQVLNDKKCAGLQGTGFFFQIVLAEPKSSVQPYPPEIKSFLEEFSKVFETPTSIPPKRLHDHRILLQPDVEPAIRKWRPYLLGRRFIVRTDHQSLKYLLEQRITTPAQSRWLPKLLGYDYAIEYKKGPENQAADSLSRMGELQFLSISIPHADWWPTLQQEVREDPFYASLASRRDAHKLTLRDGAWFQNGKIFLSPNSTLIHLILTDSHSSPIGGHFGFHKTLHRINQSFIWPKMRQALKDFLKTCEVCQQYKADCMKPAGLLQPLPIPTQSWIDVSMDFIEGLPMANGHSVIMVVVDRLTKYAHFVPMKHPFSAASVARAFVANVVRLHGVPASIVSDRDKVFTSHFWQALFRLQGTKLCMSSSYHPQTDGQSEVVNRTLEQYLRCFAGSQPKKWVEWIPWAEFSYNTSIHSATKITPFEAVYGKPPPSLLTYVPGTARVQAVDEYLQDRDQILRELRRNLQLAQERMKSQANQHRREVSFNIGDYVYLKLQPYRQTSIAFRGSLKLSPRFYGPYKVIERIGPVAYKLDLPVGSLIHDTFHVSLLRKHLGTIAPTSPDLPPVAADSTILPQPESILARREVQKGKYRPKSEVLIKWVGTPVEDATWETEWRFRRAYPSFCP
ncbi:hypothetical protein F0562_003179 [Nyssa sinensis]|uniref:Integrase catalytic domain-containing protein n=1 Tax=Nyssa sinensis TaxID=561372 RepID=A0A5J5BXN2_9ASTE|nr:hypothetical protein F0562_003179 [Nyssa sinensis]